MSVRTHPRFEAALQAAERAYDEARRATGWALAAAHEGEHIKLADSGGEIVFEGRTEDFMRRAEREMMARALVAALEAFAAAE